MAELPRAKLIFDGTCPDCGRRETALPVPLPAVGDDFDWRLRDYDGFRLFMLEELAARFPERRRWTPADLEVVLVEALAAVLDQLSDMLDRVSSEAFLETARRPESVRRLLAMIGFDAVQQALADGQITLDATAERSPAEALDLFWLRHPHAMEAARVAGPRAVHTPRRMVTIDDHARRLEDHPLVLRAHAEGTWTGSWTTLRLAVICWDNRRLDAAGLDYPYELRRAVADFHRRRGLSVPALEAGEPPSIRAVLRPYLDAYRMAGQEVILEDARPVGIALALSIRLGPTYFRSEIRRAVGQALGRGPGGFFQPGRLRFGEDLHAGDVIQAVMALDGVKSVCLRRFKRLGRRFPDRSASGTIELTGLEVALCDNDPARPERGTWRLRLYGGLEG